MTVQELLDQAVEKAAKVLEMNGRSAANSFELQAIATVSDAVLRLAQAQVALTQGHQHLRVSGGK